ncbi:LOW QUALITY PROTEIN: E3 ubiquitin-protein ligase rnf213-alpha-like [Bolinopsis microptera]|uniref:LOW QUALITY PROTEIN: E3 ubiquitin-protein ligase rnf213-alpha-like n=1 Tax=Bolinopsis microptera TaxID=2820187 RepID=UPI0030796191
MAAKKTLWLQVSLSSNLAKKKKVKIPFDDGDYEKAFEVLTDTCRNLLNQHLKSPDEAPELVMVYKPEDELEGDDTELGECDDLEGMLDEYPSGKGVRVIINTDEFEDRSFFVGTTLQQSNSKVSSWLAHGATATDSDTDEKLNRSSRTSSPGTSQPRKRQKSYPGQSTQKQPKTETVQKPNSSQETSPEVSANDFLRDLDGKDGGSSAIPQSDIDRTLDSSGSDVFVVIDRPHDVQLMEVDESVQMVDERDTKSGEVDESIVILEAPSSQFNRDGGECLQSETTDIVSTEPHQVQPYSPDKTVTLTSDDTISDINSVPYLSTEEVKVTLKDSDLDTLKEELIYEEIPGSDAGEDQLNKGESEEVVPPKDNSVPKDTDIVHVRDRESSEEVDGPAVPEPNVNNSKTIEENDKDENASKRQKVADAPPEGVETDGPKSETTPNTATPNTATPGDTADSMSDIETKKNPPSEIPSVTQSGQLFSKEEVSKVVTEEVVRPSPNADSTPSTEDVSKPTNDAVSKPSTEEVSKAATDKFPADDNKPSPPVVEREISTEERQQMLSMYITQSLNLSSPQESSETDDPNLSNNITYSTKKSTGGSSTEIITYRRTPAPGMISYRDALSGQPKPKRKGLTGTIVDTFKQGYQAITDKITSKKINVNFIVHAKVAQKYLALAYAIGSVSASWKQVECKEFLGKPGSDAKVFKAIIEDVPEDSRILYKFLKYSVSYLYANNVQNEWEYLDRNQFHTDAHQHANRLVVIENESKTVYVAVRFSYVSESQLFHQYLALLQVIQSQNHSNLDICIQLDSFVYETLVVIPEVKHLFKENFQGLTRTIFKHSNVKSRLMLLWLLPNFSRRVKGQHRKDTLDVSTVKECTKMLIPLVEDGLEPPICAAALKKLERLLTIHQEDCPQLVIPLYVMRNKVKESGIMEDEDDYMMGHRFNDHFDDARFPLDRDFFVESKEYLKKVSGLLKFCARSADLSGLTYLVQTYPKDVSVDLIVSCVRNWDIESFVSSSMMTEKSIKAAAKLISKHVLYNLDSINVTENLEQILDRWGRRLHEYTMRRNVSKRETRSSIAYSAIFGGTAKDESWFRIAASIFSGFWQCYIISTIKWKSPIKDVHSALLNSLPLTWWTTLFEGVLKTTPLSENKDELYDDNYQAEAEKFILERFRIFMNNKDDEDKKKLIEDDSFLDEVKVPQKMINVMIDTLQSFIIIYLKDNQRFYNSSKGFIKALREILLRKFPTGVNYSHLLVSDTNSTNYFPWEMIFELSEFKNNDVVKDAKETLKDSYEDIRSRDMTLQILEKLIDENSQINNRFQFLVTKVVKVPATDIKAVFTEVATEFGEFQMILRNCHLLIESFGKNKSIDVRNTIPALEHFSKMKIKDLWTRTDSRRFKVLRRGCFSNLSDAQILTLRYVKMVADCRLYGILITRQFNETEPEQCNRDDLLTDLVIKAYEPAFSKLRGIIENIGSEQILQSEIKKIFNHTVYGTYGEVRKDLLHICHAVSDLYPERISDNTFKKLEIILSDLKSSFESLDLIKKTLNITTVWKDVEKLRKTVCKEQFEEALSVVDAHLDLRFFYKLRDTRELVNGFAKSQELITWIKEIAKDEKDIGTFIDLANTLEDAATSDRLSGLHRIILAIRPLVFDVRSDGQFSDFQRAFDKMYKFVEGDTQITDRLIDVTENLKWFKEMQDLQTDTTKSSISQVENMKAYGRFIVGCNQKRTGLSDFFEERKIDDLMKAEIVYESGDTKHLKYKDLKELNDKLVLISGQQNYHEKVLSFTQVFGKLTQICDVYKELNECGHANYQKWVYERDFKEPAQAWEDVNKLHKDMLHQLEEEKNKIEDKIREYAALTNFTRLQLLYLRNKLSVFKEDEPPSYYHETLILLQAISPQVVMEDVKRQIYIIQEEFESTHERDLLSIDQLGKILTTLMQKRKEDKGVLKDYDLGRGMITLLKVPARDMFRCVLSLFMHANRVPTAEEVLCCTQDTTEEQISVFLRRAIFSNNFRQINCLVSPEKLSYQLNKHFVDEYERLSKNSTSARLNYLLLVITVENVPSEIASSYVSRHKQVPLGDIRRIKEFTEKTILQNDQCRCDPNRLSGRLIQSEGSGNGKTRKANLILDEFAKQYTLCCVPIHKRDCDRNIIVKEFLSHKRDPVRNTMYLVDVSPSVREGADVFIFELLILKKITDSAGRVFRPFNGDYVLIEGLFSSGPFIRNFPIDFTNFLPVYDCLSPQQSLDIYRTKQTTQHNQTLLEAKQFKSEKWQRVYQYLLQYRLTEGTMANFTFSFANPLIGTEHEEGCVDLFLRFVKIKDPSWRELDNFVCFLNTQLLCYENCSFTNTILAPELGAQFNAFVVKFMITMSEEFATRSLNISEGADVLEEHALEKLWDKTFHPYLFFNNDGMSFTFIGFKIQAPGDLVDVVTDEIRVKDFMNQDLLGRLRGQRVTFKDDYSAYTPELLMNKLESVLDLRYGKVKAAVDYQLTLDNTIKILAIHMRMRSNIPVVIMGETGCGKTRLIAFMCDIIKQSVLSKYEEENVPENVNNLITLRVHGGITSAMISAKIAEAEEQALFNKGIDEKFETIVFFDEANATSEIDLIREIMCNHTINGRRINSSIRFIAAVNPYRKHTPDMIELLKKAGLGYRTGEADVVDRIGDIPLRELVYRVHPLPPSLKPLIWDFGSMDNTTEKQYITLIIKSSLSEESINESFLLGLVDIISGCQDVLRTRTDQCSFVSLRDVNRFIEVFKWFMKMTPIFAELAKDQAAKAGTADNYNLSDFPLVVISAINAIGVCYYVRISARVEYLDLVAPYFRNPFPNVRGHQLLNTITRTQRVLLHEMLHNSGVGFQEDVAENEALRENIFMMVVCIELNIPLFIVGHPGSSKSLAKLIVKGCMSGLSSNSQLLEHLCQIHMTSFQCSPQSEAEGIERTFESAKKFISDENNTQNRRLMPVVVLDEIGLAEDSKKMPLKALHSLLENSGSSDQTKIGFIGISNWSLDPAKMNRGLYVTRQLPDLEELKSTAIEICKTSMRDKLKDQLGKVAEVYMEIYEDFSKNDTKSYIGLRDFYCLVKHLCRKAEEKDSFLTSGDILNGVYRNFGGICRDANSKVMKAFEKRFIVQNEMKPKTISMIRENLHSKKLESGSRYLLIVTPNLETTIDTVDQELRNRYKKDDIHGRTPQIKFNSDFPDDADYTKRCKIINDVKNSIERGDDIMLIDMEMIYESLYDVLNQYYKEWQGNKYVEIALESHRVNCRVHDETKIILLARPDQAVKFPIPLLNRMEKHYFTLRDSMTLTETRYRC